MGKAAIRQVQTISQESVMTGFCYAFTYALLQKLKKLKEEGKHYKNVADKGELFRPVDMVVTICDHLREQTKLWQLGKNLNSAYQKIVDLEREYDEFVSTIEEFLAIFEDNKTPGELVPEGLSIKKATRELEKSLIQKALEETGGNRTEAAKLLELSYRALLYKMKDWGMI